MRKILPVAGWLAVAVLTGSLVAQTPFPDQPYQRPEKCLPCHQRQFDELHSSVKSGYRSVSPLMNALEMAGNFLNGGLLRPVYADSQKKLPDGTPLNSNLFTTPSFKSPNQARAGFCFSCHAPHIVRLGDEDKNKREVPEIATGNGDAAGNGFRPDFFRPLRDYHLVDGQGNQVLAPQIGGPPPPGSLPSLAAAGISCDICHNVSGPDLTRSVHGDGFANVSLKVDHTIEKIGPFAQAVQVKDGFHVASTNPDKIAFIRSSAFCNSCHDVRVPLNSPGDFQHYESNTPDAMTFFRLENLSTEWQIGAYNSASNPFGKVVRCQDCHMSQFPFTGDSTYQVGDMKVTTPTPGVFATNFAAVPGVSTEGNFPLQKRQVVNHNFTGIDVPLLTPDELSARLGPDYPDPYQPGTDEYGIPKALAQRREALLKSAVRISLDTSDKRARPGQDFNVRVQAVSLTGHRFPAGFSQERTTWIELTVKDANGFVLYQSGYQVDKPHPDTGETDPDGNLDDEDLEHARIVANPGRFLKPYATGAGQNGHTNQVFDIGPDDGPDARVYAGIPEGLVLFRNELTRIFLPGDSIGRSGLDGKPIVATKPHYEETVSAGFANTVDNFRSLQPLVPRVFRYAIKLPTLDELQSMSIQLQGPLQVHAQVNFEHFPALFMRFLARTTGINFVPNATDPPGPTGPSGNDNGLVSERVIDQFLKNNRGIATADFTIALDQ